MAIKVAINYTLFAAIATIANIGSQDLFLGVYNGADAITLSVMVGTAVGLITKYVLDKHYIFKAATRSLRHDAHRFSLYTMTGIGTTLIFWAFEFGFEAIFSNKLMRYLGAVIGLAIGYMIKYRLDKHFVFRDHS